jgi:hypothetical protein
VWDTSAVDFANGTSTTLSSCAFTNLSQGAVSLTKAALDIENCTFTSNNPQVERYPSVHRNIACLSANITVASLNGEDGRSSGKQEDPASERTPISDNGFREEVGGNERNVVSNICTLHRG